MFSFVNRAAALVPVSAFAVVCMVRIACAGAVRPQSSPPAVNEAPRASEANEHVQEGYSLLSRKDAVSAEAAFRKAIAADPKLASAHYGLGLALWDEGRKPDGVRELTLAASLDPGDFRFHDELAKAAWSLADESLGAGGTENEESRITAGAYRGLAITQMQAAAAIKPHDPAVYVTLAQLYLDAGKPKNAISEAQAALRLQATNASAIEALGRAYEAEGNAVQAMAEFEQAVRLNPHNGALYLEMGNLQLSQHDRAGAEKAFRQAIETAPNFAPAYAALGQLFEAEHQPAEARAVFERDVALDPSDWRTEFELGKIYESAGNVRQATQFYEKALEIHPDYPAAREELAIGLLRRGDLDGATAQALRIARHDPEAPESHQILALVQWKERKYASSLDECAMVLAKNPRDARMLATQALDLWQEGEKKQARESFLAASKLEPNLGSALAFCRLAACGPQDISIVGNFVRKNRWILMPPPEE